MSQRKKIVIAKTKKKINPGVNVPPKAKTVLQINQHTKHKSFVSFQKSRLSKFRVFFSSFSDEIIQSVVADKTDRHNQSTRYIGVINVPTSNPVTVKRLR